MDRDPDIPPSPAPAAGPSPAPRSGSMAPGGDRRADPLGGWRVVWRAGLPILGILLATLLAATELVRRLDIQFWQPWTCKPALNLHVFQREPGPFDVVFLGPSTLQRGLLPEKLQPELDKAMGRKIRFFSVGQPGPKYRTYRTIVSDLLTADHAPELLILAVGGELFHETDQTDDYFRYYASLYDLAHYRDYGSVWHLSERYDRNRFRRLGAAAIQGAIRGIPTLWQWLGGLTIGGEFAERCERIHQSRGFPELGWDIRLPKAQWREGMRVRLEHLRTIQTTVPLRGAEAHALEETLRILRARAIPTVLVRSTPAKITQKILRMPACKRVTKYYHILSRRFGVEFLDLAKPQLAPPLRMYNDPYHLNREGATRMTPFWAHKVIAPRLRWIEAHRNKAPGGRWTPRGRRGATRRLPPAPRRGGKPAKQTGEGAGDGG